MLHAFVEVSTGHHQVTSVYLLNSHSHVYNTLMLEGHLTTKQASERHGLTDSHFRRLLERGTIQGFKAGRDWLIDLESLEQYMANRPKPGRKPKDRKDIS